MPTQKSIFHLETKASHLPSAKSRVSESHYEKLPPDRNVSGDNFANGEIRFKWSKPSSTWWLPSKSFVRMRVWCWY